MAVQSGGKTAQKINTSQGGSNLFLVFVWGVMCFVSVAFLSENFKTSGCATGFKREERMG